MDNADEVPAPWHLRVPGTTKTIIIIIIKTKTISEWMGKRVISARQRNKMQEKMWVVSVDRTGREDSWEEIMCPQQNDGGILHFQTQLASFSLA